MFNFISQLGTYGWPLVIIALTNVFLIFRYGIKIFGREPDRSVDINRIMIFAVLALTLGIFSHFSGLYLGLRLFAQFSSAQFAAGYAVSLLALLFGFAVFIVSLIFWFALRLRLQSISNVNK